MDIIRHDIDSALHSLRRSLAKIRSEIDEGPVRWKEDERLSATAHWATWGLIAVRRAANDIAVLDLGVRRVRMSEVERSEVESVRHEVAEANAYFVARGATLLPSDIPAPTEQ